MKIRLIGPGGAGKSTVGALLSELLVTRCIDLDASFVSRFGDVGRHIEEFGYRSYASRNVEIYLRHDTETDDEEPIIVLSSGFMTYAADIHPAYDRCRADIVGGAASFVLLPSVDLETCVRETVRRQMARPFARSADREEAVIRQRFDLYQRLPVTMIETMRPPMEVARDVCSRIRRLHASQKHHRT
ncbi:MAG: shikimate kinase [Burkholderiaceae bacterium]